MPTSKKHKGPANPAIRAALTRADKERQCEALIFDTETTGLIENRTVSLTKQPHMIEFYGQLVNLRDGSVKRKFHSLVKPPIPLPVKVKGDKGIAEMTGITEEMLDGQPVFKDVAADIFEIIKASPMVIAHNLSFDMDMVDVEFERLNDKVEWPKRKVCTVEQTIHLRGRRLNLTNLHSFLFPGETFTAHRAINDVLALTRCAVELFKREII
jgi:DNA polymerase III epsilon subunit-like protein